MSIENPHLDRDNPEVKHRLKLRKLASWASISVALILIFSKLVAYMVTDSVSIMSSLMDSTFDFLASGVTMFSIMRAAMPADRKHRYGHGKIESLAAIAQSVFIIASAGYLFLEAMHRFVRPQEIESIGIGIEVMLLSIILTVALVSFQHYVVKKTESVAIKADHLHYKGDLLMNLGVIGSLLVGYYMGWVYFDPIFATLVSFFLLYNGIEIAKESLDILTDRELSEDERNRIKEIVKAHVHSCGIHDLRTRFSGQQVFIEFHLEMDQFMSLKRAHDVTEEIEAKIYECFPKAEVLIHQEPCGIQDHRRDHQIKKNKT